MPQAGADRAGVPAAVPAGDGGRVHVSQPEHHAADQQQHCQRRRGPQVTGGDDDGGGEHGTVDGGGVVPAPVR